MCVHVSFLHLLLFISELLFLYQPVFDEHGQVVGIASSHLRGAGNIGYIIPSKIVSNFLDMCRESDEVALEDRFSGLGALVVQEESIEESKHVPGIPNLAILGSQTLESKALRHNLGLDELDILGGVRIVGSLSNNSDSSNIGDRLEGDDVLLSINGIPIGMDGTIQLSETRPDERINFRSIVTCQRVGALYIFACFFMTTKISRTYINCFVLYSRFKGYFRRAEKERT